MEPATGDGVIREGELYTFEELKKRLSVGDAMIRQWRREGLLVIRRGNRPFFSGRHVIAFMEARANDEVDSEGGPPEKA